MKRGISGHLYPIIYALTKGAYILIEKKVKTLVFALGIIILCVLALSSLNLKGGEKGSDDLEAMLCNIEGVDEVSVVFNESKDENKTDGVAVIYKGKDDEVIKREIYELISALYDIPYNRIFVSY